MRVRCDPTARVLRLQHQLDVTSAADIREILHTALDETNGDLIVDLAEVERVDVTGLGVLVGTHHKAIRTGRRLVLRDVHPRVMRLLAVTRLHRVLCLERPRDIAA